ncbi:hypothetical protein DSECCO2_321990 [anaerobic digester metagenome]
MVSHRLHHNLLGHVVETYNAFDAVNAGAIVFDQVIEPEVKLMGIETAGEGVTVRFNIMKGWSLIFLHQRKTSRFHHPG